MIVKTTIKHNLLFRNSFARVIFFNARPIFYVSVFLLTPTELYNNYRMCSTHVEDSQFKDPTHTSLMPYAIPTIFESVPNPPPKIASKRQRNERHTPELHSKNTFN